MGVNSRSSDGELKYLMSNYRMVGLAQDPASASSGSSGSSDKELQERDELTNTTDRDRHLSEDPEFNSFEFKRKYVTYEEKERAFNRLSDMFDKQKSQYHQERKLVTDNMLLFIVNMMNYDEMRKTKYPAITIDPASNRNRVWCPPFLDLSAQPRNPLLGQRSGWSRSRIHPWVLEKI